MSLIHFSRLIPCRKCQCLDYTHLVCLTAGMHLERKDKEVKSYQNLGYLHFVVRSAGVQTFCALRAVLTDLRLCSSSDPSK